MNYIEFFHYIQRFTFDSFDSHNIPKREFDFFMNSNVFLLLKNAKSSIGNLRVNEIVS